MIAQVTETKQCNNCHEVKPLTDFHKSVASKDNRTKICKSCAQKANERNRKKAKDQWAFLF